jgi:hypothetical protein
MTRPDLRKCALGYEVCDFSPAREKLDIFIQASFSLATNSDEREPGGAVTGNFKYSRESEKGLRETFQ